MADYAESSQDGAQRHAQEHDAAEPQGALYVDDSQIFDHEQQNAQRNYSDRGSSRQSADNANGQNGYGSQEDHYSEQQQYYQYEDDRNHGASGSRQNGNRDDEMW